MAELKDIAGPDLPKAIIDACGGPQNFHSIENGGVRLLSLKPELIKKITAVLPPDSYRLYNDKTYANRGRSDADAIAIEQSLWIKNIPVGACAPIKSAFKEQHIWQEQVEHKAREYEALAKRSYGTALFKNDKEKLITVKGFENEGSRSEVLTAFNANTSDGRLASSIAKPCICEDGKPGFIIDKERLMYLSEHEKNSFKLGLEKIKEVNLRDANKIKETRLEAAKLETTRTKIGEILEAPIATNADGKYYVNRTFHDRSEFDAYKNALETSRTGTVNYFFNNVIRGEGDDKNESYLFFNNPQDITRDDIIALTHKAHKYKDERRRVAKEFNEALSTIALPDATPEQKKILAENAITIPVSGYASRLSEGFANKDHAIDTADIYNKIFPGLASVPESKNAKGEYDVIIDTRALVDGKEAKDAKKIKDANAAYFVNIVEIRSTSDSEKETRLTTAKAAQDRKTAEAAAETARQAAAKAAVPAAVAAPVAPPPVAAQPPVVAVPDLPVQPPVAAVPAPAVNPVPAPAATVTPAAPPAPIAPAPVAPAVDPIAAAPATPAPAPVTTGTGGAPSTTPPPPSTGNGAADTKLPWNKILAASGAALVGLLGASLSGVGPIMTAVLTAFAALSGAAIVGMNEDKKTPAPETPPAAVPAGAPTASITTDTGIMQAQTRSSDPASLKAALENAPTLKESGESLTASYIPVAALKDSKDRALT